MNINLLILYYLTGQITREQLEKRLVDIGLFPKIVNIHLARADRLMRETQDAITDQQATLCDAGQAG